MMTILRFCKKYLVVHKITIMVYIIVCVVTGIMSLLPPYVSGKFVDFLISGTGMNTIFTYSAYFAILNLGLIGIRFISSRIYTKLHIQTSYKLNSDVIEHVQNLSYRYLSSKDIAYLNQRISGDSNAIMSFSLGVIQNVLMNITILVLSLIMLLVFNLYIGLVISTFIFLFLLAYKIFRQKLFMASYDYKEKQSYFFNKLHEQLFNIKLVKNHGISHFVKGRLDRPFHQLLTSGLFYQKISYLFTGLDTMIMGLAQIALFILGGIEVFRGNLTIGQFSIISTYFSLMMGGVRYFFNLGKSVQDTMVSYKRILEILANKQETNGTTKIANIGSIELRNVAFWYEPDKAIIDDFSVKFTKGKIYALLGENGVGKSTLVNLLLGLHIDDYEGDIYYDGVSVKQIDMIHARRNLIGFAEQDPILLKDTFRYNLLLSEEEVIDETRLAFLSKVLGLENLIKSLPHGLDSVIDEKAGNISGGEKYKISLMRLFLKNSDALVLDEPTTALDSGSSERLISYLDSIKHDKIIIVITHDKNMLTNVDEVITLAKNDLSPRQPA